MNGASHLLRIHDRREKAEEAQAIADEARQQLHRTIAAAVDDGVGMPEAAKAAGYTREHGYKVTRGLRRGRAS